MTMNPQTAATLPDGFEAHYQQHIQPGLEQLEQQRRKSVALMYGLLALPAAGVGVLVADLLGADLPLSIALTGFVLLFGGVGGALLAHQRIGYNQKFKLGVIQPACQFLGYQYTARPGTFAVERFTAARVVPANYQRVDLQDHIRGTHDGVPFESCRVTLKNDRVSRDADGAKTRESVTAFEGLLLQYALPHPVPGETRLVPRFGPDTPLTEKLQTVLQGLQELQGLRGSGKRVALDDPLFERSFQAYATSETEARILLTPELMTRLLALARRVGHETGMSQAGRAFIAHPMSVAFSGQHVLIAIVDEAGHWRSGSLFRRLRGRDQVASLVQKLALVRDVIDVLGLGHAAAGHETREPEPPRQAT